MKPAPRSAGRPLAAALALLCSFGAVAQTFDSGSTGADGALNPTVNTVVDLPPSGILNYTTVNIPTGVTVTFKRNTLNTPAVLLVQGNATIAGTINLGGTNATPVGSAGDGIQGDDGLPGIGGPGGFDGGPGGAMLGAGVISGGAGRGPGGGAGGLTTINARCWGAGAGHSAVGQPVVINDPSCTNKNTGAGVVYGSDLLLPLIGGSGGGGGSGRINSPGAGGGGGGGAILIAASGTLNVAGAIRANGGWGGLSAGSDVGAEGAGGSGGAIRLVATTISGNGTVEAVGGCQVYSTGISAGGCGVRTSAGRIRIEGYTITRTAASNPADTKGTPGPLFVPNSPTIRIATVAGQAVPATPTGNADITLPTTTTNPVAVTFTSSNVPLGNTILLTVTPANGAASSAMSNAISGTLAAGTATVDITLPQGPSVLQAQTTYTIVASLGDALSNFAANERVERLEVVASLGGAPAGVKLVTVSGKTFEAPPAALALIDTFNTMQAMLARSGS